MFRKVFFLFSAFDPCDLMLNVENIEMVNIKTLSIFIRFFFSIRASKADEGQESVSATSHFNILNPIHDNWFEIPFSKPFVWQFESV